MGVEDVLLLEKNIWTWKMSSCWRRKYGYGRCLLIGEESMAMEDAFLSYRIFLFFYISYCVWTNTRLARVGPIVNLDIVVTVCKRNSPYACLSLCKSCRACQTNKQTTAVCVIYCKVSYTYKKQREFLIFLKLALNFLQG